MSTCNFNSWVHSYFLCNWVVSSALAKHLSGFIGVASTSAGSIPDIGWKQTRMRIEGLALDPVAQYLFYSALLIVWTNGAIPPDAATAAATSAATAAIAAHTFPWWLKDDKWRPLTLTCLMIPILVREIVSTLWVIADVLVLYHSAKTPEASPAILKAGKGIVDALMSILLTPKKWRSANAVQRQKLLAKLVGKTSLGFEVGTTFILLYDALRAFLDFSTAPVSSRPGSLSVAKRILCARLMINFMLVRRRKIADLVTDIRGGAIHVPGRVLDCLLEPSKSLGLDSDKDDTNPETFFDWICFLFGF